MNNKPKVVIDTNVFINGLFFPEKHEYCSRVMDLIDEEQFNMLFSQDSIGELLYVAKNFAKHNISDINDRIELLQSMTEQFYHSISVNTLEVIIPQINDSFDEMFLECAIGGNANYIITNDIKSGLLSVNNVTFNSMTSKQFIEHFERRLDLWQLK